MQDWTDQKLLKTFSRGQDAAFSVLMNRHSVAVKAFSLRMLRNPEQAEEVCSETFLRLAMSRGKWEDRGFSFRSFLFRIANNLCVDILRKHQVIRKSSQGVLELTLHQQMKPSPEAQSILGERAGLLEQAIGELSEEHRQVILMRSIHGFSSKEAAQILGSTSSQVDSMLSYARKKLKLILSGLNEDPRTQNKGGC